ncbi:MAG: ankyrin repeat domain-containing protein [Bacteroidota bacterium]
MRKLFLFIITIFTLIVICFDALCQNDNIFHDRKFWKAQPSLEEIKSKIAEGNSPIELTEHNFDAISYAILEKNPIETVKLLLDHDGNGVNKLTHDARTYIFWAAYKGDLDLMKFLVKKGANTNIVDQHGYSLFMFAAVTGQENQAIYDYIAELGADVISEKDRQGRNALLAYAGRTKTGKMVEYFLDKGLDIHSVDENGNGIFNHAAKTGNQAFMERLINEYGVDIRKNAETNENAILFASTRYGYSDEETGRTFYEYLEGLGLDPTIVSKEGKNALHNLAFRTDNKEVFEYFLSKEVDVNQIDEEGNNVLINASAKRNKEIISLIQKSTDDINLQNKDGISSFTRALKYNKLEVAKYLESKGADVKVIDKKGYDLGYHLVDAHQNMETFIDKMDYLVSLDYDPLSTQKDGSTLLHAAIDKQNVELLKYLVELGININVKDNNGQTVLHYAAMQVDDDELLKYLIEAGADKNMTTEFDESAYDLAKANELLSEKNTNIDFLRTGGE